MSETDGKAEPCVVIGNASLTIGKLASALAKAQGQIRAAAKDSKNPFFNSLYSDLAAVWDTCREPLSKNGIAVIQRPNNTDGSTISLSTILAHESGEWMVGTLTMKPVKSDPQGLGSCLTYARRYALAAMVGICSEEDDDGNKASHKTDETPAKSNASEPQRKSDAKATPPAEKAQAGEKKTSVKPLTASGFVVEVGEANRGGYVSIILEGVNRPDGNPRKLSTREKDVIGFILDRQSAGERVSVEYIENENPKFADSIIKVLEVAAAGDAQE